MKKLISIVLVLVLVLSIVPAAAFAKVDEAESEKATEQTETRTVYPGNVILDENSSGGYEGDYVVIYNPALSSSTSYSTGNMSGLIETSISPSIVNVHGETSRGVPEKSWRLDVDGMLDEMAQKENPDYGKDLPGNENAVKASYNVGDTKTFKILAQYSPTGSSSVSFECLYVGQHCYIWTPVSSSNNTYPLDEINSNYAAMAAAEFDSKFDLMQSSFGNHTNGSSGDGKLHMLYYNINDGWNGSGGYIGGFFYQVDITNNGLPILNIDTYPGITYGNYSSMDNTYNTMVHEYQHLINYSNTSGMNSWMNECWSAAAEEICYPGSSIVDRIQSWENHYYSSDWLNPPKEIEYNPTACPNLHQGYSMYGWSNDLDDVLALYGQVSLFAQYLFSRYGNSIYKTISSKYSSSETSAITSGTGMNCADLVKNFRVALVANTLPTVLNGTYSFTTQANYDPSQYHDVENPYSLLAPVVFTGTSCSIKGGGAITVKPVNGVYNPPSGASSSLKYIGVKFVRESITSVTLDDMTVKCGSIVPAALTVLPADTTEYTATFSSSNPLVFTVDANGKISGLAAGSATLSVVVHDNIANTDYNASATVTVENFHGYVRTDTVEVGEKFILISDSAVSGSTGYAVGNQAPANNHYMSATAVTILTDDCIAYDSSIDFDAITWIPAGSASAGYTWQNVGNNKYIGTDSSDYVCPSTTSKTWLYEEGRGFKLTSSSDYPYLYYSADNTRYTTATVADPVRLYKYVEPAAPVYEITAVPNNSAYGTVSVTGAQILATPAAGYYVESAEVIQGTATVSVNGNVITVTAQSDCTIRVNFAPKPTYTVSFVACGVSEGSATAYLDDAITLPTSVNTTSEGWTFIGWVAQHIDETTDEPTYYAPGASYTVTGNTTLYALYSRVDGDGGTETVYELVTSAPSDWAGRYVITNNPTSITNLSSAYVLKGITGTSSGADAEVTDNCTAFGSTGITLNDGKLYGVTDTYVMTIAAQSSYYTIQSVGTGCYYGMNSGSYLRAYSSINSTYCRWTPAINANGVAQFKNAANGSYPYFGWSSNNSYFWSASTNNANVLRLWKETEITSSVTYYNTDPAAPTYYTVTFVDWDGTELKSETVAAGGAATAPANPTREGYIFMGWDKDFSNVTEDMTVTATYLINSYLLTVYYVYEDGTTAKTPYTGTYNYGASYSVTSPEVVGYTPDQAVVTGTMGAAPVEVTVTYHPIPYTVTFVDWDGTVLKTETVTYGGSATAPADPTREGYTFTGWDKSFTYVIGDLTVTAQYQINTYTVTFVDWDGTVLDTQTVEYGAAAVAPADPEREGWTFTGWDVDFTNVKADLTVTAQYSENGLEPTLIGDVNCDGKVDSTDALLAMRASMNLATITPQGLINGDVNGDGVVNSTDAIIIMRMAMKIIPMPID